MGKIRTEQSPGASIPGVQPGDDMNEDFPTSRRDNIEHFMRVVDFVSARIQEDEKLASRAYWSEQDDRISTRTTLPYKRLQAEIEAKREIMLQALTQVGALSAQPEEPMWRGAAWIAADNLVTVARVYKDHPDFPK